MEQRCYECMDVRDFGFGTIRINIIEIYVTGEGILVWNKSN